METDTLIVGGGLSGLAVAASLSAAGRDITVVEARHRLGGRILTEQADDASFDLGPAWFWPGQPRIAQMVQTYGLSIFEQFAAGDLVFEDEQRRIQRGRGVASMQGSYRMVGGLGRLIDALAEDIGAASLHRGVPVVALTRAGNEIIAQTATGQTFRARRVVLALPPRIAARIAYAPTLPEAALRAMATVPSWMAGQAKAVAIYDRAFWREGGLSGDAISQRGPLVEIHDASPIAGGPFALFGFIGTPANARQDQSALGAAIIAQLVRLFGQDAAAQRHLLIQDWAAEAFTATPRDADPLYAHPRYGLPKALDGLWDGRLIFAGSEVATTFGGFLEGALEAAEAVSQHLLRTKQTA